MAVGAGFIVGYALSTHVARYYSSDNRPVSYRHILRRCRSGQVALGSLIFSFVLMVINSFDYLFFSWSTVYMDTAVSSSLMEIWPVLWILAFQYIDRARYGVSEYRVVPFITVVLMILGAGAIALVIFSSVSTQFSDQSASLPILGILLGIVAPAVGALGAFNFLLTDRILFGKTRSAKDDWAILASEDVELEQVEESITHAGVVLSRVCATPIVVLVAVLDDGFRSALLSRPFLGGLLCGLLLNGPGSVLLRRAHIISSRREIISLQYLSPILSLFWLALFTSIDVARMDFLIFGTVSIVALNMLINADPEQKKGVEFDDREAGVIQERYSLKALVISLLGFGMLIFFRDELLTGYDLSWSEDGSYWAVLGLASTVFALLLAFRLTRVESLLLAEDYRTLGIVRRVEMLPKKIFGTQDDEDSKMYLLEWIRRLNRANSLDEYRHAYNRTHRFFQVILNRIDEGDLQLTGEEKLEVSAIRTELDALAHGRQHAREFAERVALWLIGGTIVVICMAVPPQGSDWARVLSEIFSIVLSSIVIYLLFHLADLRRSRADELLMEKDPDWKFLSDGLYVRFRDENDATWQRIFSGLIIVGIVATVVGLLVWNRLGFT